MAVFVGIDPGTTHGAWVRYDAESRRVLSFDYAPMPLVSGGLDGLIWRTQEPFSEESVRMHSFACESVEPYGQRIGRETIDTIRWIGRLEQVCDWRGKALRLISRRDIKIHLLGRAKGDDADVRAALLERWGGTKEKAIGTKKAPGPLYGMRSHCWSALAVAVTAAETEEAK